MFSANLDDQQLVDHCKNNDQSRKSSMNLGGCEHSYSFKIIDEFQEVYRNRIKKLNETSQQSLEVSELKIKTYADWVENLAEQNSLLAQALEELEAGAIAKANDISRSSSDSSRLLNSCYDRSLSEKNSELLDSGNSRKFTKKSFDKAKELLIENEELRLLYSKKEAEFEKYRLCVEKLLEHVDEPSATECAIKDLLCRVQELTKANGILTNNFSLLKKALDNFQQQNEAFLLQMNDSETSSESSELKMVMNKLKLISFSYSVITEKVLEYKVELQSKQYDFEMIAETFGNLKFKHSFKTEKLM